MLQTGTSETLGPSGGLMNHDFHVWTVSTVAVKTITYYNILVCVRIKHVIYINVSKREFYIKVLKSDYYLLCFIIEKKKDIASSLS